MALLTQTRLRGTFAGSLSLNAALPVLDVTSGNSRLDGTAGIAILIATALELTFDASGLRDLHLRLHRQAQGRRWSSIAVSSVICCWSDEACCRRRRFRVAGHSLVGFDGLVTSLYGPLICGQACGWSATGRRRWT